jgi:hypothetical protein
MNHQHNLAWFAKINDFIDHLTSFVKELDLNPGNIDALLFDSTTHQHALASCQAVQTHPRPETLGPEYSEVINETYIKVQACFRRLMVQPHINTFRPSQPPLFFQDALAIALSIAVEYHAIIDTHKISNSQMTC